MMDIRPISDGVRVAAFYHFAPLDALEGRKRDLLALAKSGDVVGTILLADEGVNGTIAGASGAVQALLDFIAALPGFAALEWKDSSAEALPFYRMKVRLKREIVTMGVEGVDPSRIVGRYVEPEDWNEMVERDDVVLIDTRNDYEVGIGTFEGALDPKTGSFGEFPQWWHANKESFEGKKVAMFCTGGIRCEKATSFLVGQGVEDVVHLKGGILKYLEEIPQEHSRWNGECFVFDQRVAVGHGLEQGSHTLCHACRRPVSPEGKTRAAYERGVSCDACIGDFTGADRERFRERQRQVDLAHKKGVRHFAPDTDKRET